MKKTLLTTGFLLFLAGPAEAQTDWAKVHELTINGIDRLYNLDLEKSEQTFDEVIRIAPRDPRGHFFKSMIYFWIFNLTKDEQAYKNFFDLSEKVIELCEEELDKDENNGTAKYYLGGIYGFRGLAYQRNGSILSAVWDGRKGYSYLKEATKNSPEVYDAQMGFGLFNYLTAKVPKAFRWILSLLGFSGDVEGGLESLRIAAEKGTYARNEATFFLAQFLFWENREDEAHKYLNRLLDKYPDNPLFLLTLATWELRKDNAESALVLAKKAVSINARRKIQYGDEIAYGVLSTCYFLKNDFENARKNLDLAIQKTENRQNVSNTTYYRLGVCQEILGEREKAVSTYKQLREVDMDKNPWDYQTYRLGQKRLATPIDERDILVIKAGNSMSLKNYETAKSLYKMALSDPKTSVDQRALAFYGLMQIYYDQELYNEVLTMGSQLMSLDPPHEKWLIPHGRFRLGQTYAKLDRTTEARREFDAIDDYDDYDFQSRLESRVEEEMKKLEGMK